ncbi:hypothetical protein KBZ20_13380 [Vulcanococcus limneticus Candia 3F8]|uniref:glutathione binding-like protein n=1 Tax=Vulcanococcus limneticus TaxID=2170428 RepID=UPI000B99856C|nr:hypothetical protein [Vulcanococcus limneticus MW73D5]MCP9894762.1 hypothetical protein [Vulcanococcus limneticus Candia 3F8]MCP9898208.1 hypothetical protein [Vulcanococcus limneticus Candia 3B3]
MTREESECALLASKKSQGYAALNAMENCLKSNSFAVGREYSIADLALYACAHMAMKVDLASNRIQRERAGESTLARSRILCDSVHGSESLYAT